MKIGIRVDGGFNIGLGHVYRCLWLGASLKKKGHEVIFLTTEDPTVVSLINREHFTTYLFPNTGTEKNKVDATNQWIRDQNPTVFLIDYWDWPKDYWKSLKKKPGTVLVAVDVPPEGFIYFDLAFQGVRNDLSNRKFVNGGCMVYEGPHYMMIQPEFKAYRRSWKPPSCLKKILLTFGGTDVSDFSIKVLDCFDKLPRDYYLTLVLGPGSANLSSVKDYLNKSTLEVDILSDVPCLPAHMSQSDLVISTAGSGTLSELALTGAPAIIFAAVQHQVDNARKFSDVGGVLNCAKKPGDIDDKFFFFLKDLTTNPKNLEKLSKKWQSLVDGKGIERIINVLENCH